MPRVAVVKAPDGQPIANITIPDGATEEQIAAKVEEVKRQYKERQAAQQTPAKPASDKPSDVFVFNMAPHAQSAAERIGVDPRVLLAQAALETGWGKHVPARDDGGSTNNLFGVKTGSSWNGESGDNTTTEYSGRQSRVEKARFRAYDSPAESFDDYATLITTTPRYAEAVKNASDPQAYLEGLVKGGYATDPDYVKKVMAVYNSRSLKERT